MTSQIIFVALLAYTLTACSLTDSMRSSSNNEFVTSPNEDPSYNTIDAAPIDLFDVIYQEWEGVPYRLGGNTKSGIDCSAFIQIVYRDMWNRTLPRTTWYQSKMGTKIDRASASRGDLIFFRISRSTRHVGIYLGNNQFMHASSSKGITISLVDNPYWASKFWHFRRVLD